jgi:glycerophosphoryl diester phosphodiesterase
VVEGLQGNDEIMDTLKFDKGNTLVVAHRGLSGVEFENTYVSFVASAHRSYYGIETDVHVNKDGEFIIIHDDTTSRVSGGKYQINVEETSFDEISDIVLPDLDGSFDRGDIRVPKLSEYIKICKKHSKEIFR